MSDIEPDLHDMHDPVKHEYQNKENKTPETYQLINADDDNLQAEKITPPIEIKKFWDDIKSRKLIRHFEPNEDDTDVDFVLQYNETYEHCGMGSKFRTYLENLMNSGLLLNMDEDKFIKIQVPTVVAKKYCEILKIKMQIDPKHVTNFSNGNLSQTKSTTTLNVDDDRNTRKNNWDALKELLCLGVDKNPCYWAEYNISREYLFCKDRKFDERLITKSTRINIAYFILQRAVYGNPEKCQYGFENLLHETKDDDTLINVIALFPLHDSDLDDEPSKKRKKNKTSKEHNIMEGNKDKLYMTNAANNLNEDNAQRKNLYNSWSKLTNISITQPIEKIKEYLGVRVAIYFAWLQFYTNMMLCASIFGVGLMIYGFITLDGHNYTKEICNSDLIMCPLCNVTCGFWYMRESCNQAKLTHLFDNNVNIGFTLMMTLWSVLYLKLWKRYAACLTYKWGLSTYDIQNEHSRPKYIRVLRKNKDDDSKQSLTTNNIDKKMKNSPPEALNFNEEVPVIPFWKKQIPLTLVSFSTIFLWIALVLCAVAGIILYRMSRYATDKVTNKYYTAVVTAIMNLALIMVFRNIYDRLAVYLTNLEYIRTQMEYDESLAVKMYLFQFVNTYSSIIYIAFIKGKLVGYPGKYIEIFGYRQLECDLGGCYLEIFIQLSIILIGQKIVTYLIPYLLSLPKLCKAKNTDENYKKLSRCKKDYKLEKYTSEKLYGEYMEMVIQYGFVVLFVNAFPLAPLVALINNLFEMRFDAQKYIERYQRPVPQTITSVGIWLHIMEILGRLSIFSSSIMIAFSSKFIPYMAYVYHFNDHHTDDGFLNHTLSYFNVNDFQKYTIVFNGTEHPIANITECRYRGYRNDKIHGSDYDQSSKYWTILFFRILFVITFQIVTVSLRFFLDWVIPDVPKKVDTLTKNENKLIRDILEKEMYTNLEKHKDRTNDISDETKKHIL